MRWALVAVVANDLTSFHPAVGLGVGWCAANNVI